VNVTVITPSGTSTISTADQFTYIAAAPSVVSLVRFGFHMEQTSLVLTFSAALDPTRAQNVNNYHILTMSGTAVAVSSAVYDPANLTVTLVPSQRLSLHVFYQLTVNGTTPNGLTSATGVPLDGQGNGTPGTNYVRRFSGGILAGPAPAMESANPKKFAAERRQLVAIDRRLAAARRQKSAAVKRHELAAEKRKAAVPQTKLVAHLRTLEGPSASAVDALAVLGVLTAKPKEV
jgi:hypothetical protein